MWSEEYDNGIDIKNNLLKELKLENRIVTTVEDFVEKDYSETINYMNVNKKINDMRNSSLSWLKKSVLKK